MNSNKCPKCGFLTLAKATVCKNCSYQFEPRAESLGTANSNSPNKPQSWADTFCAVNLFFGAIILGIVFCLYWNAMVLSRFLPSGSYPLILIIVLYLPAAILAIICAFGWFAVLRLIFKTLGVKSFN